ncbi:MAG: hypothetical protein ACP5P1_12135 [Acidimicrobiales bacterium]
MSTLFRQDEREVADKRHDGEFLANSVYVANSPAAFPVPRTSSGRAEAKGLRCF